jgi:hypothetical protein
MSQEASLLIGSTARLGVKVGKTLLGPAGPGATGGNPAPKSMRKAQRKARKATRQR